MSIDWEDIAKMMYPQLYGRADGMWEEKNTDRAYDSLGRGASPRTAMRWESFANAISPGTITDRIPVTELMKNDIYVSDPRYLDRDYEGSGSYYGRGRNRGSIQLMTNRTWQEMLKKAIIQHEMIHKKTGSMGGANSGNIVQSELASNLQKWEAPWRWPQERLAYQKDDPRLSKRFYMPEDIYKVLPDELSDWNYAQRS